MSMRQARVPTALAPFVQVAYSHGIFQIGARMTFGYDKSRAVASWYHGFGFPYYGGFNQWGEPIADISAEMNATGCGARSDMDGVDVAGSFFATMSDCSDVEITEADRPFLYVFRNFLPESRVRQVQGRQRHGIRPRHPWRAVALHGVSGLRLEVPALYRRVRRIRGSHFIGAGGKTVQFESLAAGEQPAIPANLMELFDHKPLQGNKVVTQITTSVGPYVDGDVIFVSGGGGAGYGDVLERDPAAVIEDVRLGHVTPWQAEHVYKVIYDPKDPADRPGGNGGFEAEGKRGEAQPIPFVRGF